MAPQPNASTKGSEAHPFLCCMHMEGTLTNIYFCFKVVSEGQGENQQQ